MTEIIKCNRCGQVLIEGSGALVLLGQGVTIGCRNCGASIKLDEAVVLHATKEKENENGKHRLD